MIYFFHYSQATLGTQVQGDKNIPHLTCVGTTLRTLPPTEHRECMEAVVKSSLRALG